MVVDTRTSTHSARARRQERRKIHIEYASKRGSWRYTVEIYHGGMPRKDLRARSNEVTAFEGLLRLVSRYR
jgi:hypothetical protein